MDFTFDSASFDGDESLFHTAFRLLQEAKKKATYDAIDYTVLSVAVATLGLILVVELIRHKLDSLAQGRPFFKTVLEGVNSELATLGIVEFVVFLIQKYYAGLDKAQKEVFADVHFMLFYCALFNALQSVLLAVTSYSVANRLWVRTEQLELDHYIEIREEFERVDGILYSNVENHSVRVPASEFVFEYNLKGIRKLWTRIYRFLRYPILSQRHADLLVQVRFHDLRVHFLKANELPLQLKVSDYLKRSLLSVLQKLVHISAVAWLLLTGAITLLYFLMGIVIYVTEDLKMVGTSLTWIYLCSMIFFVVLSLVIYNKMKWIFSRIMRMKLQASQQFKSGMSFRKGEKEILNQKDLFWGSNPNIITVIIQFAQFGFALSLAVLLVFWDDINVKGTPVAPWVYIFTVFICYAAFVAIMAQVIPRYTLCTSLGQLVDKSHLQETLGEFYLQEAERKRKQRLFDEQDPDDDDDDDEDGGYIDTDHFEEASALSKDSPTEFGPTTTTAVASNRLLTTSESTKSSGGSDQDKNALLADLVQTDTESLRRLALPLDMTRRFDLDGGLDKSLRSQNERKLRRKAVSDGVAMMRQMTTGKPPRAAPSLPPRSRLERKKSNSASDAIQEMQNAEEVSSNMRRSTSGPSLSKLSRPSSAFEPIHEHEEQTSAPPTSSRRTKTPSSSSAPLPPLDEHTDEVVETGVEVAVPANPIKPTKPRVTIESFRSVNDVPEPATSEDQHDVHEEEPETLLDVVKDYFAGPKYPVVSAVFGTLVCFWVVGQRIEELLLATGTMPDLKNTFQFPLNVSFWWETAYLCCFILASAFIFVNFGCGQATSNRERTLSLAGFLDVVLASTCLALLMIAEAKRCYCVEGDDTADCCPSFGSRSYGGVGNIEPITSIIALRIFRFWISKKIIRFLDQYTKWSSKDAPKKKHHHHGHDHGHHGHGHGHGDPRELAIEVWKGALCLYPEVVEEHGEFSTELLQTMLGVSSSINKPAKPTVVETAPPDDVITYDADVSADETSAKPRGSYVPKRIQHQQSLKASKENAMTDIAPIDPPMAIDYLSDDGSVEEMALVRPNAKILRSMRRCDRKLLPLINTWSAVDVVMTKYEIVYFEAVDFDDPCKDKYSTSDLRAMEEGRKALTDGSGGKGLRLKDVLKGRKIVGHMAMSDIDNVHVDRILPHEDKKLEAVACPIERDDEFWEPNGKTDVNTDGKSREARWAKLKEDRLMIHSDSGTLCLRFYSDLNDMETHRDRCLTESERKGKLHKDLALLWCQTIGRICKRSQLKQKLEHYGDNNDEELRDYLRVVDPKNDGNERMMDKIHRRASSAIDLLPRPRLRRSNSVPDEAGASSPLARPKLSRGKTEGAVQTSSTRVEERDAVIVAAIQSSLDPDPELDEHMA